MHTINFIKKVIAKIEKCYAVCPITIRGIPGFLVATEKSGGCFFFNLNGELIEQIWSEPGGVMSLVPVPGKNGQFLSTQEFYSPNDSKNARIILATPLDSGCEIRTLAELPFVHRFDILVTLDANYLVACTLKSDHNFKEDWTHPGKVLACKLPPDFTDPSYHLEFQVLMEGLTKNHGFYRGCAENPFAIVSSENGIFKFSPPSLNTSDWQIEKLLDLPASDATLVDLDGDGLGELVTFSPFHGDDLAIYHLQDGKFALEYSYPAKVEFLHAIWSGKIHGQTVVLIGHRKAERALFFLAYDPLEKSYIRQTVDLDCGPANVTCVEINGSPVIISTNRETDELAMYSVEKM